MAIFRVNLGFAPIHSQLVPKQQLWGQLMQVFVQVICPFCHPINSVKILTGTANTFHFF